MCRTNMARLTPLGLLNTSRAIRGGLISNTIYWLECCNISSTLPSSRLLSRDQITLSLSSWSSSLRGTHLTTLRLTSSSTVVLQSGLVRRDVAPPWRSSWDICPICGVRVARDVTDTGNSINPPLPWSLSSPHICPSCPGKHKYRGRDRDKPLAVTSLLLSSSHVPVWMRSDESNEWSDHTHLTSP